MLHVFFQVVLQKVEEGFEHQEAFLPHVPAPEMVSALFSYLIWIKLNTLIKLSIAATKYRRAKREASCRSSSFHVTNELLFH